MFLQKRTVRHRLFGHGERPSTRRRLLERIVRNNAELRLFSSPGHDIGGDIVLLMFRNAA
jgi:hypothetical protein